jgi:NAD(P)-dependent dehydrogenase (short-subunit alcohol dehydrogenase family)
MKQRYVLITGAQGELGRIVTSYLSERGWTVVAWSREKVDVSDSTATQQAFASILHPIHAVVHLVGGIVAGRPVEEMTDSDFDTMIDLNLRTTFNVLRYSVPLLRSTNGAIVTIAAMAAHRPSPLKSLYAASKAGVVALTQAVAEECRQSGVRAVCISPGIINTPSNQSWSTIEERSSWIQPEYIAQVIDQCIDPQSTLSGSVIQLDNDETP